MKFAIIVFPGSNCDHDCYHVLKHVLDQEVSYVWHKDGGLKDFDCVVLPGGFSYGDYLRTGSIARFSPVMKEVVSFALKGGLVIGICNGFQILTESGLLPGVLMRNRGLKFICSDVNLRVENNKTVFTSAYKQGEVISVPIAHGDGNFFLEGPELAALRERDGIVFTYSTPGGEVSDEANPNGSVDNIAGIINKAGNVLGMMPHPERASEAVLGGADGRLLFQSIIEGFALR
ncbi:MAG: phosphoribosylformylglycinamidine synthase subunit PurQ [Thermodesulfobacteriota bacterium]